jgi:8-oxo-dGTP diphosphatase
VSERPLHRIVAGVLRQGDTVLLVRQQGPDDPEPNWALPGGLVEASETLAAALVREVREETGLTVGSIGRLAYVAEVGVQRPERLQGGRGEPTPYVVTAFVFELAGGEGDVACADPDGYVLTVEYVPLDDAVARLERHPYRPMAGPIAAYLRGTTPPGVTWRYRRDPEGDLHLVACDPPGSWGRVETDGAGPVDDELEAAYGEMALDHEREREADGWIEANVDEALD